MLIRTTSLAALMSVVLLSNSFVEAKDAQPDAAARFHQAYVQEVIEGKVKEAAVAYLALMNDDAAPTKIRGEARFRFAVCTVLLGRSDEGATQLRELVSDTTLSEALRTRATHYLKGVSRSSTGSASGRTTEDMITILAPLDPGALAHRADGKGLAGVYRLIEVGGEASIVTLRRLLKHRDLKLRQHAYRLLCRMNVDGMAELYESDIGVPAQPWRLDVQNYLRRSPGRNEAMFQRLKSLGSPALNSFQLVKNMSLEMSRKFLELGGKPSVAFQHIAKLKSSEQREEMLRWYRSGEENLKGIAANQLPRHLTDKDQEVAATLLREFVDSIMKAQGPHDSSAKASVLARKTAIEMLQSTWQDVLKFCEVDVGSMRAHSLMPVLVAFQRVLSSRTGDDTSLAETVSVVRRYVDGVTKDDLKHVFRQESQKMANSLLWEAVRKFPEVESIDLAAWMASGKRHFARNRLVIPPHNRDLGNGDSYFQPTLNAPRDVRVFMAGLGAARRVGNTTLGEWARLYNLRSIGQRDMEVVVAREWLTQIRAYMKDVTHGDANPLHVPLLLALKAVPADELSAEWLALIEEGDQTVKTILLQDGQVHTHGKTTVVAPKSLSLARKHWSKLSKKSRYLVLQRALNISMRPVGSNLSVMESPITPKIAAEFILSHLDEAGTSNISYHVPNNSALFPPQRWLASHPEFTKNISNSNNPNVSTEQLEGAVRDAVFEKRVFNRGIADLIGRRLVRQNVAKEVMKSLITSEDASLRRSALMTLHPASHVARLLAVSDFQSCLAYEIEHQPAHAPALIRLSQLMVIREPGPELIPLARTLLEMSTPKTVQEGIRLASSLGHDDLVPDLKKLLSSLDIRVRDSARKALEAIRETRKLQREAAVEAAGR